jgi:hypothetical protein
MRCWPARQSSMLSRCLKKIDRRKTAPTPTVLLIKIVLKSSGLNFGEAVRTFESPKSSGADFGNRNA